MEFIAQFTSSIAGTQASLITDVFLDEGKLIVFRKSSSGAFELSIVENNSYLQHTKEFENFLELGRLKSSECNLLNIWRASKVLHPTLMPMRYYEDILSLYKHERLVRKNNLKNIKKILNKANDEIDFYL